MTLGRGFSSCCPSSEQTPTRAAGEGPPDGLETSQRAGTTVAVSSVLRLGSLLFLLGVVGFGCRGPTPRSDLTQALDAARLERVARLGHALLPDARIDWGLSPRTEVGAWAWPDRRIRVSRALVDLLDDNELAAALGHELGHLLDRGDLPAPPVALLGGSGGDDLEVRADQIGCRLLAARGIAPAMAEMLAKVSTRCRGDGFARRIAAARAACPNPAPAAP
jgi:Zn-dependent protease with chaperone function